MEKADNEKLRRILALARDLAGQNTDIGLDKAAEILLRTVEEGYSDPELLITSATCLLQGSGGAKSEIKQQAVSLADRAVALMSDDISLLEAAVHCYESILNDFPDKLDAIIRLNLKILDLDPDHIEAMVTLATHREHPGVALSLEDTIRMLEWAQDVAPHNPVVAITLSRLYLEAGKFGTAKKLYRKVFHCDGTASKETASAQQQLRSLRASSQIKRYRKYGRN